YADDGLIAVQGEDSRDGEAAEAKDWTFKDDAYKPLLPLLVALQDAPALPVLPQDGFDGTRNPEGSVSVLYVHSVQLVDEYATEEENQLRGLLDDGCSFYITCTTDKSLDAFLLDVEGRASRAEFSEGMRLVRLERVEINNAHYLRSALRNWLSEAL